jgi:hypothetical protein
VNKLKKKGENKKNTHNEKIGGSRKKKGQLRTTAVLYKGIISNGYVKGTDRNHETKEKEICKSTRM